MIELKLFKMLEECCFYTIDNEKKIHKGDLVWIRFGEFGNGGWPQMYDAVTDDWCDFCMYDNYTTDWSDVPIAEEIPKDEWSNFQHTVYNILSDTDKYFKVCEEVEQVFKKYNVYVRPSELAETIADLMDVD